MNESLAALSNELAAAVENAAGAVVGVHARPRIASSGIHWREGVVVAADHNIRFEEEIQVSLADGRKLAGTLAGRDPGTDLAVLRVPGLPAPAAEFRDSTGIRAGDLILTVGRPYESGVSAAMGIVSGVSGAWRTWRGGLVEQMLRLDVAVYPGSGGSAAIDPQGRILGMVTSGLSRFAPVAVPAATIERVAGDLLAKGRVTRGYLGVGMQPILLPDHLLKQLGREEKGAVIVLSVEPETPAAAAGVQLGDILLSLDNETLAGADDVQAFLGAASVGKTAQVSILRAGAPLRIPVLIAERPGREG